MTITINDVPRLQREIGEARTEARAILDRAGNADLTGPDAERFDTLTGSIESHTEQIGQLTESRDRDLAAIRAGIQSGSMRVETGSPDGSQQRDGDTTPPVVQQRDDEGQRIAFTDTMATRAAEGMLTVDRGNNTRALASSGSVVVEQGLAPDPVPLGRPINSLLAALPVVTHPTAQFAYLRQSVRTNNAAVVADGAVKPTSVFTVVRVSDQLDVVAHLSEGVPKYWLVDAPSVAQFLGNEMRYGLQRAVESVVLSTINATSGIATQPYSTSPLVTLRKSMTTLESNGYTASAFVLTPADWESIELVIASSNALEYQGLPFDPVARRLWGVPVVVTTSQAAGVSHTIASGAVAVDADNVGVLVEWSETSNSDDWSKNLIRARCEGRYAASIYQPLGVVVGDLTP